MTNMFYIQVFVLFVCILYLHKYPTLKINLSSNRSLVHVCGEKTLMVLMRQNDRVTTPTQEIPLKKFGPKSVAQQISPTNLAQNFLANKYRPDGRLKKSSCKAAVSSSMY
jgi:hypothetical protein